MAKNKKKKKTGKEKKPNRSWRKLGIAWLGVFGVGLIGFALMINSTVKKGLETAGLRVAGVETRVETVKLSPFSGKGEATGIFVGNPEGFRAPSAIEVGRIVISLKPTSVFFDRIIVRSARIEAPVITLEGKLAGNNLSRILENISEAIGSGRESESGDPTRIQLGELVIADARVRLGLTALGGRAVTIPLPEIRMADLGSGPQGITVGELAKEVLSEILREIRGLPGDAVGRLGKGAVDALKSVGDRVGDARDRARRLFKRDE